MSQRSSIVYFLLTSEVESSLDSGSEETCPYIVSGGNSAGCSRTSWDWLMKQKLTPLIRCHACRHSLEGSMYSCYALSSIGRKGALVSCVWACGDWLLWELRHQNINSIIELQHQYRTSAMLVKQQHISNIEKKHNSSTSASLHQFSNSKVAVQHSVTIVACQQCSAVAWQQCSSSTIVAHQQNSIVAQ